MGIILNMIKRICIEVLIGIIIIVLVCTNNIYYPIKEVYSTSYRHEDIYFKSLDEYIDSEYEFLKRDYILRVYLILQQF